MTKTYRTTKIEWTEHTWNPMRGCTPVSEACDNCYARRISKTRFSDPDFKVQFFHDRIYNPWNWRNPRMVFVCSMGDLFHKDVPDNFVRKVYHVMMGVPHHTFQILTKRPERMNLFVNALVEREGGVPRNIWHGTTTENQRRFNERIDALLGTKSVVKFISAEPLLGLIDMGNAVDELSWIIAGGETGPGARPFNEIELWGLYQQTTFVREVPFFFKARGRNFVEEKDGLPMPLELFAHPEKHPKKTKVDWEAQRSYPDLSWIETDKYLIPADEL